MNEIKAKTWDGKRLTTNGIMFNNTLGKLVAPNNQPITLYTGFEDKKGNELYDLDIFVFNGLNGHSMEHESLKVIWHFGGWYVEQITCFVQDKLTIGTIRRLDEIQSFYFAEKIGNSFENPELLNEN